MIKSWFSMWRRTFCFTGTVSRKEYWLALIANVIAIYVGVIPYALLCKCFTDNAGLVIAVYLVAFHLPVLALYFRRAKDMGWKISTILFLTVVFPMVSGLMVGIFSRCATVSRASAWILKILACSYGLFFYGGVFGIVLYDDPTAIPFLPISGLLLATFTLIVYGIVHWRQVVAYLGGSDRA